MINRRLRLNERIRDEMGKIIAEELEFPEGTLVTVIRAEISEKLGGARIFISVFPKKFGEEVIRGIKKRTSYLRALLKTKLRIRIMPQINFILDRSMESIERIEEILNKYGAVAK